MRIPANIGTTILRVVTGIIFTMHGWQKLTESGLDGTAGFFTSLNIPLPTVMAAVVIAVELLGGIALILGIGTRWISIPLAITMIVAMVTVHFSNGFFAQTGGYEYTLMLLGACVALFFLGSGAYALDTLVFGKRGRFATA